MTQVGLIKKLLLNRDQKAAIYNPPAERDGRQELKKISLSSARSPAAIVIRRNLGR